MVVFGVYMAVYLLVRTKWGHKACLEAAPSAVAAEARGPPAGPGESIRALSPGRTGWKQAGSGVGRVPVPDRWDALPHGVRGRRYAADMTTEELLARACPPIRDNGWAYYFVPETEARGKELGLDLFQFYVLGPGRRPR